MATLPHILSGIQVPAPGSSESRLLAEVRRELFRDCRGEPSEETSAGTTPRVLGNTTTLFRANGTLCADSANAPALLPSGQGIEVSNSAFLNAIAADRLAENERFWTASFSAKPSNAGGAGWKGALSTADQADHINPDHNAYFSVAAYPTTATARSKATAASVLAVVIDDAGAEGKIMPALKPSWVLQTSASKTQVGFMLTDRVSVEDATPLHDSLGSNGLLGGDSSGHNPVRYARLPVQTNNKYLPRFRAVMLTWEPDRRYTLAEVEKAFGFSRIGHAPKAVVAPQSAQSLAMASMASGLADRTTDRGNLYCNCLRFLGKKNNGWAGQSTEWSRMAWNAILASQGMGWEAQAKEAFIEASLFALGQVGYGSKDLIKQEAEAEWDRQLGYIGTKTDKGAAVVFGIMRDRYPKAYAAIQKQLAAATKSDITNRLTAAEQNAPQLLAELVDEVAELPKAQQEELLDHVAAVFGRATNKKNCKSRATAPYRNALRERAKMQAKQARAAAQATAADLGQYAMQCPRPDDAVAAVLPPLVKELVERQDPLDPVLVSTFSGSLVNVRTTDAYSKLHLMRSESERKTAGQDVRAPQPMRLVDLNASTLKEAIGRVIKLTRTENDADGNIYIRDVQLPASFLIDLIKGSSIDPLPRCDGCVDFPLLLPNYELVKQSGYDDATRLFFSIPSEIINPEPEDNE
jgi:hypothetical protein